MSSKNSMILIVRSSPTGRGVFATELIRARTLLMHFTGPLLRYAQTTPQTLALQIGPDLYVGESGGPDDCVNHSCDPNAGLLIDGTNVRLIALRDIAAGEQIAFDYSTTMDEDDFEFDCLCRSEKCRGRIRDFKHLPLELKREFVELGIVPEYNRIHLSDRRSHAVDSNHSSDRNPANNRAPGAAGRAGG